MKLKYSGLDCFMTSKKELLELTINYGENFSVEYEYDTVGYIAIVKTKKSKIAVEAKTLKCEVLI